MDPQKPAGAAGGGQQPAAAARQKPIYDTRNGGHYGTSCVCVCVLRRCGGSPPIFFVCP